MNGSGTRCGWLSIGLLIVFAGWTPAAAQDRSGLVRMYELTELEAEGGGQTRAYALNNRGQITGWVEIEELRHSAHWHNESTTDLHGTVHFELLHPLFDQDYSESYDISDGGQIVGTARTTIECPPTFVITNAFILRPAVLTDLATPYPGDALANLWTFGNPCATAYDSAATGISNKNHVVGWADRDDGVINAFLVTPVDGNFFCDDEEPYLVNDLMHNLGSLRADVDPTSSATSVNDAGQVTGYAYTTTPDGSAGYHAFLVNPRDTDSDGELDWFSGINGVNNLMTDLGTLGGTNSWGRAINNEGQVVGESDSITAAGERYTRAFLLTPTRTDTAAGWVQDADNDGANDLMTDLGTLRDDPTKGFSAASGVNDQEVVVGWAENEDRERRAFIYENGEMKDLNELLYLINDEGNPIVPGIVLTEARDINEDGAIVGWGVVRGTDSTNRGFLLTPVWIDPSALEETDDDTTPTDVGGGTGGVIYSSETDFGPPDQTTSDTGADQDSQPEPEPVPPAVALCGSGTLAVLPLALAGLCLMRTGRRR